MDEHLLRVKTVIYRAKAVADTNVGTVAYRLGYKLLGIEYGLCDVAAACYVCRYGR